MTADIEDGIKVFRLPDKVAQLLCSLPNFLVILQEVDGDVVFCGFD
jgi:hypothetical protein